MKARYLLMLFAVGAFIGLSVYLIQSNSKHDIQRPNPTTVGFRELVEKTDDYSVYRDCKYTLESVTYDTIPNRKLSTIETPAIQTHPIPDRVDLNEIFDPRHEGDTDWNHTEIEDDDFRHLDSLGIYWDERYGCYRKHK